MVLAILLVHHNTHPINDSDDESQSIIGPTQNESDSDNDSQYSMKMTVMTLWQYCN